MYRKNTGNIQGEITIDDFIRIVRYFRSVRIIGNKVILPAEHEFSLTDVKSIHYKLEHDTKKDNLTVVLNNRTIILLYRDGYQQYDLRDVV